MPKRAACSSRWAICVKRRVTVADELTSASIQIPQNKSGRWQQLRARRLLENRGFASTAKMLTAASATSLPAGKENAHAALEAVGRRAVSSPQPRETSGRSPLALAAQPAKTPGPAFLPDCHVDGAAHAAGVDIFTQRSCKALCAASVSDHYAHATPRYLLSCVSAEHGNHRRMQSWT